MGRDITISSFGKSVYGTGELDQWWGDERIQEKEKERNEISMTYERQNNAAGEPPFFFVLKATPAMYSFPLHWPLKSESANSPPR
jgi:hypothetical protein